MPPWHIALAGGVVGAAGVLFFRVRGTKARLEARGAALEASLGAQGSAIAAYLTQEGTDVAATLEAVGQRHARLVAGKAAREWLARKYNLTPELLGNVARLRARIGV